MSKRSKGTHGIYELTCISHKCSRRFKVIYDIEGKPKGAPDPWYGKLTYPFTGCPFCGTWWPTGPLDGEAYPKRPKPTYVVKSPLWGSGMGQANVVSGGLPGGSLNFLVGSVGSNSAKGYC
ncbi:hypothetical protein LCGC14_1754460 [marine sediment metagenome]|uniref:Uncharacterized protein n=1 Tax=marine sediment metagenome TaxID=412755 RepID=A0A0F9HQ96_9ZZZZ